MSLAIGVGVGVSVALILIVAIIIIIVLYKKRYVTLQLTLFILQQLLLRLQSYVKYFQKLFQIQNMQLFLLMAKHRLVRSLFLH